MIHGSNIQFPVPSYALEATPNTSLQLPKFLLRLLPMVWMNGKRCLVCAIRGWVEGAWRSLICWIRECRVLPHPGVRQPWCLFCLTHRKP